MLLTRELVCELHPCYSESKIEELVPEEGIEVRADSNCLELLLNLPTQDARWLVSNLLSLQKNIEWANRAVERAKSYAHDSCQNGTGYLIHSAFEAARAAGVAWLIKMLIDQRRLPLEMDIRANGWAREVITQACYAAGDQHEKEHRAAMTDALKLLTEDFSC